MDNVHLQQIFLIVQHCNTMIVWHKNGDKTLGTTNRALTIENNCAQSILAFLSFCLTILKRFEKRQQSDL